jgi:hypothetical protein
VRGIALVQASDEQVLDRPSYGYVLDDGGWRERQRLRMLILDMCRRRRRGRRPPTVGEKGFFARPGPPAVGTTPTDRTGVRQTSGPGSTIHADGDDNDADDDAMHTYAPDSRCVRAASMVQPTPATRGMRPPGGQRGSNRRAAPGGAALGCSLPAGRRRLTMAPCPASTVKHLQHGIGYTDHGARFGLANGDA